MEKVTKSQIEEWKKRYGFVKEIVLDRKTETETDPETGKEKEKIVDPGKVCYLRKPDRATIKYATTKIKDGSVENSISAGEIILKKCWLAGDEEINTNDKYYFRASIEAYGLMNTATGFL